MIIALKKGKKGGVIVLAGYLMCTVTGWNAKQVKVRMRSFQTGTAVQLFKHKSNTHSQTFVNPHSCLIFVKVCLEKVVVAYIGSQSYR